ncbi:MAG: NTP transferase domain-containing protein, partial [Candidatus Pacebacteria bacterium]|nr:NTP transferase domain-containing protein [Candidatus Paceibacterota bacterium]
SFKDKDLLKDMPVGMLDICGKPVLQRTIENLNILGIQDIAVIVGYQGNKIFTEGIRKIENPNYQKSGVMDSIMLAAEFLDGEKNLIIYSDILFEKEIVEKILKSDADIVLAIDGSYQKNKFPKKNLDLVMAKYPPIRGERVINVRQSNQILRIGKEIPREQVNYEFIGITMVSKRGAEKMKAEYQKLKEKRGTDSKIGLIDLMQEVINSGFLVEAVEVNGGWTEIKNFDDYRRAYKFFSN